MIPKYHFFLIEYQRLRALPFFSWVSSWIPPLTIWKKPVRSVSQQTFCWALLSSRHTFLASHSPITPIPSSVKILIWDREVDGKQRIGKEKAFASFLFYCSSQERVKEKQTSQPSIQPTNPYTQTRNWMNRFWFQAQNIFPVQ